MKFTGSRFVMPALGLALLITMVVGCGTDQPTSMMDGVDQEALQSYEEMVAAEEARMTQADAADE